MVSQQEMHGMGSDAAVDDLTFEEVQLHVACLALCPLCYPMAVNRGMFRKTTKHFLVAGLTALVLYAVYLVMYSASTFLELLFDALQGDSWNAIAVMIVTLFLAVFVVVMAGIVIVSLQAYRQAYEVLQPPLLSSPALFGIEEEEEDDHASTELLAMDMV